MSRRRRAIDAYRAQKKSGERDAIDRDLFAVEAALSLARNALDEAETSLARAPLEALLEECADAAVGVLLPPPIGALLALHESLEDLLERVRSPETLPLSRLVARLGDLVPGLGWATLAGRSRARMVEARRAATSDVAQARAAVIELRAQVRRIRTELSRLGRSGLLLERIG